MAIQFLSGLGPRTFVRLALFGVLLITVALMLPSAALQAQPDPDPIACWLVGDGYENPTSNDGGAEDTLLRADINPFSKVTVPPGDTTGHTGTLNIEAIEWEYDGGTLYAADAGEFGTIDTGTGIYSAILDFASSDITICERGGGTRTDPINDVDGLAYDLRTDTWWGTDRNGASSSPDVLFRFDPIASGELVIRGQFTVGSNTCDGVEVQPVSDPEGTLLTAIDDIAFDPFSNELYGVANTGYGSTTVMVRIDRTNGDTTDLGTIAYPDSTDNYLRDTEGLGVDELGTFYVSTGKNGADVAITGNRLFKIDRTDLIGQGGNISAVLVGNLEESRPREWPTDFESNTCYNLEQQAIAFLGDRVWRDNGGGVPANANNGIQDSGEPGVAGATVNLLEDPNGIPNDGDEFVVDTVLTAFNGNYLFTVTPGVAYIVEFDAVGSLTLQNQGGNDTVDSDADPTTGRTDDNYVLVANEINEDVDAGLLDGDLDWGDAPDPPYATLAISAGANHTIGGLLYLGQCVDGEGDGQPNGDATGDDNNTGAPVIGACTTAGDDEDGVSFDTALTQGQLAQITVTSTQAGILDAWIDFDGNGSWDASESLESLVGGVINLAPGANVINFTVPAAPGSQSGITFARFRVSTSGGLAPVGFAPDGEVEDYEVEIIEQVEDRDWGDAPDPSYPTKASPPDPSEPDGASHVIGVGGPYLGACVDSEGDGQPNSNATGDDAATGTTTVGTCDPDGDDEDGVTFGQLVQGDAASQVTVVVSNAAACVLNAWIDFDGDQTWDQSGEQIFTDLNLTAGSTNPLTFFVPGNAAVGTTYARFRCDSLGGLLPYGPAADGEVEDYEVIIEEGQENLDWGDAPDGPYPTLSASNGANHVIGPIFLGAAIDAEPDGQPTPGDDGDDNDADGDDEDGVTFASLLSPGTTASISVVASSACTLSAWMDFNGDGDWDDSGEDLFPSGQALVTGSNPLSFVVPPTAQIGRTHARFRCSTVGKLPYDGSAPNGEVEDYLVVIVEDDNNLDYGDLPDLPYPTLLSNSGAYHVIDGTFLGIVPPDPEPDGQPTPPADGDDLNDTSGSGAGNDEDGVVFLNPLMPGTTAQVQVTAGTPGYLCAYIDFDGDGTLDTVSYTAATSGGPGTPPPAPGTILETYLDAADIYTFDITVPGTATGTTPSRFRFTAGVGQGCSTPEGGASTGEVEDYNLASIGDLVWDDTDVDGIQDTGEPGLPGITVELWLPGGTSPIATTTTDGNGNYEFPGVPPGDYIVEFVAPANHGFSPKDVGTDDTVDSDADLITGRTDVVTLAPGDVNSDVDAGLYDTTGKIAIGNIVWADNGAIGPNNGQKDADEGGIDGVIVELYLDDGNGICEPGGADGVALATATTAGGGIYQFLDLTPSTTGVFNTFYCVAISKADPVLAAFGFLSSSTGGAHDPNIGDHNIANGDDGVPGGSYVITQPLAATLSGQTTPQSGEPSGYGAGSTYMTVDFGFLTDDPTAVNLKTFGATNGSLLLSLLAVAGLMLAGTAAFVRQKRQ